MTTGFLCRFPFLCKAGWGLRAVFARLYGIPRSRLNNLEYPMPQLARHTNANRSKGPQAAHDSNGA